MTIIPTSEAGEVFPPSAMAKWMLPFVTTGSRGEVLTPVDPSIRPILTTVDVGVEWWWRWKRLRVRVFGISAGFGTQDVILRRMLADETLIEDEKNLANPQAYKFKGSASAEISYPGPPPFTDICNINAEIFILPPQNTPYGNDTIGENMVDESYEIQEGQSPETCDLLPRTVITISIQLDAGVETLNYVTNYAAPDATYDATFAGNAIHLTNFDSGVSVFDAGLATVAEIEPVEWFPWDGTWNTTTGAKN